MQHFSCVLRDLMVDRQTDKHTLEAQHVRSIIEHRFLKSRVLETTIYEYKRLESGRWYFDEWRSEGKPFRPQINLDLTDVSRDLGIGADVFALPDPLTNNNR